MQKVEYVLTLADGSKKILGTGNGLLTADSDIDTIAKDIITNIINYPAYKKHEIIVVSPDYNMREMFPDEFHEPSHFSWTTDNASWVLESLATCGTEHEALWIFREPTAYAPLTDKDYEYLKQILRNPYIQVLWWSSNVSQLLNQFSDYNFSTRICGHTDLTTSACIINDDSACKLKSGKEVRVRSFICDGICRYRTEV